MKNQNDTPNGWENYTGESLFKVQGGYAFKSSDYKEEGILLVRISNVGNGKFIYKDVIYVTQSFLVSHTDFLLGKKSILMGLTGDLGKICILENGDFPFILNQRVGRFICSENINNDFLYYLLSSSHIQSKLLEFFAGGAQKNISPRQIESIDFIIPISIAEQEKIASILSQVDVAIAHTNALIQKYKRIKTGLMQDLLTKGIDQNGNIRREDTHEFKDSQIGRIPKEWECKTIGEIVFAGGGIIQTGPFGSQLHANEYVDDGTPVILPKNIKEGKIDISNIDRIKDSRAKQLPRHIVLEDNIVFARVGDLSKCVVITPEYANWMCGTNCLLIRPPKKAINSEWLSMMYKHHICQTQISFSSIGSTMQTLNSTLLSNLLVFKLDKEEQNKIIIYLTTISQSISAETATLSKLLRLKSGLMQDLLSGKVRV